MCTVNLTLYTSSGTQSTYFRSNPGTNYSILWDIETFHGFDKLDSNPPTNIEIGVEAEPSDFVIQNRFDSCLYDLADRNSVKFNSNSYTSAVYPLDRDEAMKIAQRLVEKRVE